MTRNWIKGRRHLGASGPRNEMIFSDIVGAPVGRCGRDEHRARWSCAYMRLRSKWSVYLRALQLRCRMARSGRVPTTQRLRKLDTPLHHCIRTDRFSRLIQDYLRTNPPTRPVPAEKTRQSSTAPGATTTRGTTKISSKEKHQQFVHVPMINQRLRSVLARTIKHVRNHLATKVARIKPRKTGGATRQARRRGEAMQRGPPGPKGALSPSGPAQPPIPIRILMPFTTRKEWWPFRRRVRVLRKNLILIIVLVVLLMAPIIFFRVRGSMICFGRKAECYMPTCKEVREWQWQLRNCGPTMLEIDCLHRRLYYTPYDTYIYTSQPPVTKARQKYVKGIKTTCPDKMKILVPKGNALKGGKDKP